MKTISLFLALSIAAIASGCGGMFKGKKAAEQSAADFHKLYNDGKLAEIYSAGHSKFKSATTEKQFVELMGAVQRKLGKVTQTANAGVNVRTFNLTTTVVLNQNTTFEQGDGDGDFHVSDGRRQSDFSRLQHQLEGFDFEMMPVTNI